MSDVNGTETESSRKRVSKRDFLDADGNVCERMEEASGARYTLLDPNGNHEFEMLFGEPGRAETMFAIFGFHTKIGNVANTVLNDKNDPGSPSDAAEEVRAFMQLAEAGKWAERTGTVGARVDRDALTAAIVEFAAGKGQTKDPVAVRQALDDNPALIAQFRKVPEILAAYTKRVGAGGVNADTLLGKI
jgi:hypothetical protein